MLSPELNTCFWNLRDPESTVKLAWWAQDMGYESIGTCPIDEGHHPAKRRSELSVALPRAAAAQDIVWTWYSECLLQDHVLELFRASGFTGFEVKPVKVKFKRVTDCKPPRLWEMVVTGWGGMAPPESGIRLLRRCDGCGHSVYSGCTHPDKLIDCSHWDGSDFFMVWPLPLFIFVTNRVAATIRSNHLTGANLMPPDALDLSRGFSPGRLSHWMPEQRAHALGKPLGID